jgi:hypothetical protein
MKKQLILTLILFVSVLNSFGQKRHSPQNSWKPSEKFQFSGLKPMYGDKEIAIGGHASIMKLFGSNTMFGIGVNGLYSGDAERNAYFVDISQFFGGKVVESTYAYANSSAVDPRQVDVELTSKFTSTVVRGGWRRYLVNDISEEGFKMYFNIEAGVMLFKGKTEATDYDENDYNFSFEPEFTASGLFLGGGYGFESRVSEKASLFGELNLTIPATSANGTALEVEIPGTILISFGARFTL